MNNSGGGFSNQQALLALLICFPIGLISIGLIVILLQRPAPQVTQPQPPPPPGQEKPLDQGTTIQPLPSTQQTQSANPGLNELEARGIVERWLTIKSQIFAPPFDTDLADQVVAAGPLWTDITKPGGSIDWLKANNSYYTYSTIRVNQVISFTQSPTMPSIVVSVTENYILHSPKGGKATSGTSNMMYILKEESGTWKIWDYRKQ